jgi:hypothetical protein
MVKGQAFLCLVSEMPMDSPVSRMHALAIRSSFLPTPHEVDCESANLETAPGASKCEHTTTGA